MSILHRRRVSTSDSSDGDEARPKGNNAELLSMFTEDKTRARGVSISSVSSADFDIPAPVSGDEAGAPGPDPTAEGDAVATDATMELAAAGAAPAAQAKRRPIASAAESFRAMCFKKVSQGGACDASDSGSDGDGPMARPRRNNNGANASGLAAIPAAELVDFLSMMADSAAAAAAANNSAVTLPVPVGGDDGESAPPASSSADAAVAATVAPPKVELPASKPLAAAWNGAAAVAEAVSLLGDILILRPVKQQNRAAAQGRGAAAKPHAAAKAAAGPQSFNTVTLDAGCLLLLLPSATEPGPAAVAAEAAPTTEVVAVDAGVVDRDQLTVVGHVNAIFGHVASCRYVVRVPADRLETLRTLIRCPPRDALQNQRSSDDDEEEDADASSRRFVASRFAVATDSLALVPDLEFLTAQSRANATDASHVEDNELPENATPDFSDDEKERTFKAERKAARKARREQLLASGMTVEAARRHEREVYGACAEDDDAAEASDDGGSVDLEFDAEGNVIGEKKRAPRAPVPPHMQRGRGTGAPPHQQQQPQYPSGMMRGGRGSGPIAVGAFGMSFPPPPGAMVGGGVPPPLSVTVGGRGGMLAPHMTMPGGRGASFGAGLPPHHSHHQQHHSHHQQHHSHHHHHQEQQRPPRSALDMYMQAGTASAPASRGPLSQPPPAHPYHAALHQQNAQAGFGHHHHHHHHSHHQHHAFHPDARVHGHAHPAAAGSVRSGGFMDHPSFQAQQDPSQARGTGVVAPPMVAPLAAELLRSSRRDHVERDDADRRNPHRVTDRAVKKRRRSYSTSSSSASSVMSGSSGGYSSSSMSSSYSYSDSDSYSDSASSRRSASSETTEERRRRRRRERERRERRERERRRRDRERRRRRKEKEERRRRREKEERRAAERESRALEGAAIATNPIAATATVMPSAMKDAGLHSESRHHRGEHREKGARRSSRDDRDHHKRRRHTYGDHSDSWSVSVRGGESEREPKRRRREPSMDGLPAGGEEDRHRGRHHRPHDGEGDQHRRRDDDRHRDDTHRERRRQEDGAGSDTERHRRLRSSGDREKRSHHHHSRDGPRDAFPPPPPLPVAASSMPETAMHRL